jgi:prepilin-type N-terminal cleavage/methylation domain-containing protein
MKKGFTLIELIAVIVIIGVIAIVVVPQIISVINTAKSNATLASTYSYIEAVNNAIASNQVTERNVITDGTYTTAQLKELGVEISNETEPSEGTVVIKNGTVVDYSILIDNKYVNYSYDTDKAMVADSFKPTTNKINFKLGEAVTVGGVKFHVIGFSTDNKYVLLLTDSGEIPDMQHCLYGYKSSTYCYYIKGGTDNVGYRWSKSYVNHYLNNEWLNSTKLNRSLMKMDAVCDNQPRYDSYGGMIDKCTKDDYAPATYVRLLTKDEYTSINNNITDKSWLYSTDIGTYWLANTYKSGSSAVSYHLNAVIYNGKVLDTNTGWAWSQNKITVIPYAYITTHIRAVVTLNSDYSE